MVLDTLLDSSLQVCPSCKTQGRKGNSPISVSQKDDVILAHCFKCDTGWKVWPEKPDWTEHKHPTVGEWLASRGIAIKHRLPSIEDLEIATFIRKDGSVGKISALRFKYRDGGVHQISIKKYQKKDQKTDYIQSWIEKSNQLWYPRIRPEKGSPGLILCEGEKDAVALYASGIYCMGIPGVSALTEERAKWLLNEIPSIHKVEWVGILMDNDDAGRKGESRIWNRLSEMGFKLKRFIWPDNSEGWDATDLIAKGYLDRIADSGFWTTEKPLYVESEITPGLYKSINGYSVSDEKSHRTISNCTLTIERKYWNETSLQYWVKVGNSSRRSKGFLIDASAFAEPSMLRKAVSSQGPFHFWDCSIRDLAKLSEIEATRDGIIEAKSIDGYGYCQDEKFYAFPDGIVANGKWNPADSEGLITVDKKYYSVKSEYEFYNGKVPSFEPIQADQDLRKGILDASKRIIGKKGEYQGLLILGWLLSSFYSDQFWTSDRYQNDKAYPFLMVVGTKGSGKTETLNRFMRIAGYDVDAGNSFSESSSNHFSKALYANMNLPMWYDEISNSARIKEGLVKSAFNRGGAGKGTTTGTTNLATRGTLILSGEERIDEYLNRSIYIEMPYGQDRVPRNVSAFQWLTEHLKSIGRVGFGVMAQRNADREKQWLDKHASWKVRLSEYFKGLDAGNRLVHCYAVCFAGLTLLDIPLPELDEFEKEDCGTLATWFRYYVKVQNSKITEKDPVEEGLNRYLAEEGHYAFLIGNHICIPSECKTWLARLPGFNADQFLAALSNCPWKASSTEESEIKTLVRIPDFKRLDESGYTTNTVGRRCLKFDAKHPRTPKWLIEICLEKSHSGWSPYQGGME